MKQNNTPLLIKYLDAYEKNPLSKVFAPLAESYRKMGQIAKAMEILKKGLKHNPGYLLGHLSLAECYIDEGQHHVAYSTLRPFIENNRDNIRLQRVYAAVCEQIGLHQEALETYKYLLFINPKDNQLAENVRRMEKGDFAKIIKENIKDPFINESETFSSQAFNVEALSSLPTDLETSHWMQKEFVEKKAVVEKKINIPALAPVIKKNETVLSLADLYIEHGNYYKASEVLQKMLQLEPENKEVRQKYHLVEAQLTKSFAPSFPDNPKENTTVEDEGHSVLRALIEKKLKEKDSKKEDLIVKRKERLEFFLDKIKLRANQNHL